MLSRIHVDIAFSAPMLSTDAGLGEPSLDEARTKELIAERAGTVVVLADSSKSGREVAAWAPMPTGWTWIDEHGEHPRS